MTLPEIAEAVGGTVHDDPGVTVTAPATHDSRQVEAGGLFVAIAGENVDGHDLADRKAYLAEQQATAARREAEERAAASAARREELLANLADGPVGH